MTASARFGALLRRCAPVAQALTAPSACLHFPCREVIASKSGRPPRPWLRRSARSYSRSRSVQEDPAGHGRRAGRALDQGTLPRRSPRERPWFSPPGDLQIQLSRTRVLHVGIVEADPLSWNPWRGEGETRTSRLVHASSARCRGRKQLPCERKCFVHPRQRAGQAAAARSPGRVRRVKGEVPESQWPAERLADDVGKRRSPQRGEGERRSRPHRRTGRTGAGH